MASKVEMTKMRNIIDVWNMIEKYDVEGYEVVDGSTIVWPTSEYVRLLGTVRNPTYIRNLRRSA